MNETEALSYLAEIIDAARAGGAPREHIQALQMAREALDADNRLFRASVMRLHENQRINTDGKGREKLNETDTV